MGYDHCRTAGERRTVSYVVELEEQIVAFRLAELRTNIEATLRDIKALAEQAE
ncbi:hypothetical protein [Streptomyces swartbergensis]|uniref:hypothetical protein n=1 Tax=Streptomyces swartbergensis TaxID=487165 RepID=UPI0013023CEE|nr:hypothetical protein [Streptomyces swartbergensis]